MEPTETIKGFQEAVHRSSLNEQLHDQHADLKRPGTNKLHRYITCIILSNHSRSLVKDARFPRSRGDNIFSVNIMKLMIHVTIK